MKKILAAITLLVFVTIISACEPQDGSRVSRFLHTNKTDALQLEQDYEGFSYLDDGIGLVEFHECGASGHSTFFREIREDDEVEVFRTRYLGIAIPPIYENRPWSHEARDFVCGLLGGAERIVLQSDSDRSRTDSNDRYLVYVWYDNGSGIFRNLNLELIEQAYANYTGSELYSEIFATAWFDTTATGRRIHGEDDPDPRTN